MRENNVNDYFHHQKFGNLKYLIKKAFLGTLGNPGDALFSVVWKWVWFWGSALYQEFWPVTLKQVVMENYNIRIWMWSCRQQPCLQKGLLFLRGWAFSQDQNIQRNVWSLFIWNFQRGEGSLKKSPLWGNYIYIMFPIQLNNLCIPSSCLLEKNESDWTSRTCQAKWRH